MRQVNQRLALVSSMKRCFKANPFPEPKQPGRCPAVLNAGATTQEDSTAKGAG
ncbi:hypothetical protein sync_0167 [Synechococcus sp. CC9311]|nr:hypothetical protein sync_0167 [Synechococcus sp. CC9311]